MRSTPMTGEVSRARPDTTPRVGRRAGTGVRVAQGGVYESGPTGFHPAAPRGGAGVDRAGRRLQDAPAGRRPRAHRMARRRVARQAPRLPQRRRGVGARRAHRAARDLPRLLEDARDDPQRARQRMSKFLQHGLVPDEHDAPTGRRRSNWTEAALRWARSIEFDEADDAAAYEHYTDAVDRCGDTKRELERRVVDTARAPSGRRRSTRCAW